jgi:hypothetical protein
MTAADLAGKWRIRCRRFQLAHYESARRFMLLHYFLGVTATLLATIVARSVFSELSKATPDSPWSNAIRAMSVIAAVFTALQTFLKYSERAEKHRISAAWFSNLKDKLELQTTFPPATEGDWKLALDEIEGAWQKLREDSPTVPSSIWRKVEARVKSA